jgi:cysteinyl-tRNA synthetase
MNEILDHPKSAKEDRHSLAMCYQSMRQMARVLGILEEAPQVILERMQKRRMLKRGLDAEYIQGLLNERQAARAAKNFAKADELRRLLMERGVVLQDSASGVGWSVMPNRADEP